MRRECPNCYEKWASSEARIAAWRAWAGLKILRYRHMLPHHAGRLVHAVISFPDLGEGIVRQRKLAERVAVRHGLTGGALIYHPFRQEDDSHFAPDGYVHFHTIAFAPGNIAEGGSFRCERRREIVFKVIRDAETGDYRGIQRMRSAKRLIHYLLSHAGILEGRHALTWYGDMSWAMLSQKGLIQTYPDAWDELSTPPGKTCPVCGSRETEPCEEIDSTSYPWRYVTVHPYPSEPPDPGGGSRK